MTAVDFVKMTLEMSRGWVIGLAADAKDIATTAPTPKGGNHPLWVPGSPHLRRRESHREIRQGRNEPGRRVGRAIRRWNDAAGRRLEVPVVRRVAGEI